MYMSTLATLLKCQNRIQNFCVHNKMFFASCSKTLHRHLLPSNGQFNFPHMVYLHRSAIRCKKRKREETCPDMPPNQVGYCSTITKMRLDGKIAMVIGGTGGIGCETASKLLKNGCKHVVVTGTNSYRCAEIAENLNNRFGREKASSLHFDVLDPKRYEDALECVWEKHCALDVLVNTVGFFDEECWEKSIKINVEGIIRGTYLAQDIMNKENGGFGGVIINVAGVMGVEPMHGAPAYTAAKHAVLGFTRSIGTEQMEKKTGIRVMCLCPGLTYTKMFNTIHDRTLPQFAQVIEHEMNHAKKQRPECCAEGILFLIRHAEAGSVWLVEGAQLYEMKIPHKGKYAKLVACFT